MKALGALAGAFFFNRQFKLLRAAALAGSLVLAAGCQKTAHATMIEDYYQAGSNTWYCSSTTTAPGATVAGFTALPTSTLILQNPASSKNKLVIQDVGIDISTSVATPLTIYEGYENVISSAAVNTTSGTVTSAFIGKSTGTFTTSSANCLVSAVLPAPPTFFRAIGTILGIGTPTGAVVIEDKPGLTEVIPPGGYLVIGTSQASNIFGHITWIEVPQ